MPISPDTVVSTLLKERSRLIGYAWVVVGDQHAAEDVFQDVSLAAVRKCEQIHDKAHLDRWLRQAIRLRGLELRRNRKRHAQLLSPEVLDHLEQEWSARASDDASDRAEALRHCIAELTGTAREVVELRYGQGLKSGQIAEQLGKRTETVYKAITRAHAALAKCVRSRLSRQGGGA
ncbi:sigma-70 family RNA polymerase sigma factor [Phycisphaeraceae bacterium D3-23]